MLIDAYTSLVKSQKSKATVSVSLGPTVTISLGPYSNSIIRFSDLVILVI